MTVLGIPATAHQCPGEVCEDVRLLRPRQISGGIPELPQNFRGECSMFSCQRHSRWLHDDQTVRNLFLVNLNCILFSTVLTCKSKRGIKPLGCSDGQSDVNWIKSEIELAIWSMILAVLWPLGISLSTSISDSTKGRQSSRGSLELRS